MKPSVALGLGLVLAAMCATRPAFSALPTDIGWTKIPPVESERDFSISGDGKIVAIMDTHTGSISFFNRSRMNGTAPMKTWENAFANEMAHARWRLDATGAKVAAVGHGKNGAGGVVMALYDVSKPSPRGLWLKSIPANSAGQPMLWIPVFPAEGRSVVFGAIYTKSVESEEGDKAEHKLAWVQRYTLAGGTLVGNASMALDGKARETCATGSVSLDGATAVVGSGPGQVWITKGLAFMNPKKTLVTLPFDFHCPHLVLSKTGRNLLVYWRPMVTETYKETTRALVFDTMTLKLRADITNPCGMFKVDEAEDGTDRFASSLGTVFFSGQEEPSYLACINPYAVMDPAGQALFAPVHDLRPQTPRMADGFPAAQEWVNTCPYSHYLGGDCAELMMSRTPGKQVMGFQMDIPTQDTSTAAVDWWAVA